MRTLNLKYLFLSALLLLVSGCIDPLELNIGSDAKRLVVDGLITNEPGPYTVKLSMSEPYATYTGGRSVAVQEAAVVISDEQGTREELTETSPGIYQTSINGIRGEVGHTYTVTIRTKEGRTYTSAPEMLLPVAELDSLYAEVKPQQVLNSENIEETVYVVNVYADAQDPVQAKNFYRWQWEGTYRVSTQPWDYSEKVRGVRVPMPKDCCAICWITNHTNNVNVQDDRLINGGGIKHHLVTQLPVTAQTFGTKYYLEVKQLSVSEAAFDFWSTLGEQISTVGSIQDPPPATIIGNISSIDNPEEKVLGFFGASAVSRKTIFVRREELGVNPGELILPDDCRVLAGSTTEQPSFW
ncbi:DUF4249 domain-containing protein [Pontibacter chitinilyticus]|uniref:DUF4249 domain-containing protein n=1 Tax=Pontibacter chitinilyticus TaxID=2674989 RepID=UPI00321C2449